MSWDLHDGISANFWLSNGFHGREISDIVAPYQGALQEYLRLETIAKKLEIMQVDRWLND